MSDPECRGGQVAGACPPGSGPARPVLALLF